LRWLERDRAAVDEHHLFSRHEIAQLHGFGLRHLHGDGGVALPQSGGQEMWTLKPASTKNTHASCIHFLSTKSEQGQLAEAFRLCVTPNRRTSFFTPPPLPHFVFHRPSFSVAPETFRFSPSSGLVLL
jgi:hypothetical protein